MVPTQRLLLGGLGVLLFLHGTQSADKYVSRLVLDEGYLVSPTGKQWVGTTWSALQPVVSRLLPELGPLPGINANDSTMRYLDLRGDYKADIPLQIPSRVHVRVAGNISSSSAETTRMAMMSLDHAEFVSVSGGHFRCEQNRSVAVSCDHCKDALIQNLTVHGCTRGGVHLVASSVVEVRNLTASNCSRGVWTERGPLPSHDPISKALITQSHVYDCHYGIDLDAHSTDVMVKGNHLESNHQAAIFIEEGSSGNFILDNELSHNKKCGICLFSNLPGKPPGSAARDPTGSNWVVGNNILGSGMYTNGISMSSRLPKDAASDNVFFENTVSNQLLTWNGAHAIGNAVMTSTCGNQDGLDWASSGNITFLVNPDPMEPNYGAGRRAN